jgi:hypothetical protein
LRTDLDRWHEYLGEQEQPETDDEPTERISAMRRIFWPDEEIRNATDPLAAILARNPPGEQQGLF